MRSLGIINFIRWMFGSVRFTASGGFSDRFLNACSRQGVRLWNVTKKEGVLTASTEIRHYRNIRPAARLSGARVRILRREGLPFWFRRRRRRGGLLLGLCLFLVMMFLLSGRIWTVEVVGNEELTTREVLDYFSQLGVRPGAEKSELKVGEIAAYALRHNDNLAWSSINIKGSNATIEIRERIHPPDFTEEGKVCNVTAKRAGQIQQIIPFEGTPLVKNGDGVAEGDLLIGGEVQNHDGSLRYTAARGIVIAHTVHQLTVEVPYEKEVVEYTGRVRIKQVLDFFGVKIPWVTEKREEGEYEMQKSEKRLIILNRGLPAAIYTETYREIVKTKIPLSPQQAEAEGEERLADLLKQELEGIEVVSEERMTEHTPEGFRIVATYICREDIAVQEEMLQE